MKVLGVEVPPAQVEKEPVVDVPAIDMTDTEPRHVARPAATARTSGAASSQPPRRRSTQAKRSRRKRKSSTSQPRAATETHAATAKRKRDWSVGRQTFAAVEELVKRGSGKTDAFKAVAEQTGRSAGTVAANYYRVARSESSSTSRRRRTAKTAAPRRSKIAGERRRAGSQPGVDSPRLMRVGGSDAQRLRDVDRLANDLVESVTALTSVVKAQSMELADLRRRLDGVRSILD